ncbi:MAG: signal peptidase I [Chloroflexi bacterium HGW-Chloroflexi-1]|nr:MAG: signal peptidase I [Chloroflexi bacterium HGW-Chloroflexi-1]
MDPQKPTAETQHPKPNHGQVAGDLVRDLLETIVPAIVIALLINLFLAQSTIVYGQSMEPNLYTDQRLVIEKLSYHLHGPQRGDVVVVRDPGGGPIPLIKRVVGLPGERVTIANGRVFVDGMRLDEPYLNQDTWGDGQSWLAPPLHIFVMGDNRSDSRDSRMFGPVEIDQVLGHAVLRYWPLGRAGLLH